MEILLELLEEPLVLVLLFGALGFAFVVAFILIIIRLNRDDKGGAPVEAEKQPDDRNTLPVVHSPDANALPVVRSQPQIRNNGTDNHIVVLNEVLPPDQPNAPQRPVVVVIQNKPEIKQEAPVQDTSNDSGCWGCFGWLVLLFIVVPIIVFLFIMLATGATCLDIAHNFLKTI